jgi:hypothetical protein
MNTSDWEDIEHKVFVLAHERSWDIDLLAHPAHIGRPQLLPLWLELLAMADSPTPPDPAWINRRIHELLGDLAVDDWERIIDATEDLPDHLRHGSAQGGSTGRP